MTALLTTSVGSFPKPGYLKKARTQASRNEISPEELMQLEKTATKEWIQVQEELGMDILVDGEMYRGDMVTYFAENLGGFEISGLVRSYGNRYYRKPIAVGPLRRIRPITVEMFKYAQSFTKKPVKGMLTGPYTICDWSFNEYFETRKDFMIAIAQVIHDEAMDLEKAGAQYIQIDEPALSTRPEEIDLAIEAMDIVTRGLRATTLTHICYGDFAKIYPRMLDMPVEIFDLEMANGNYELLTVLATHPFKKKISAGVVDVHSHVIETVDQVVDGLHRILQVFEPDQVYVDPDCGLKTRTIEESKAKLKAIREGTDRVKAELGLN